MTPLDLIANIWNHLHLALCNFYAAVSMLENAHGHCAFLGCVRPVLCVK